MPEFQRSKRVSIYLSTDYEVDTKNILRRIFQDKKEVKYLFKSLKLFFMKFIFLALGFRSYIFWQRYENAKAVRLWRLWEITTHQMEHKATERRRCPSRKSHVDRWHVWTDSVCLFIINDEIFNSLSDPLDLILLPGVAFSQIGGRLGHGMGYYDKYLHTYFNRFPDSAQINKTLLIGLGFKEQIVDDDQLPLDKFDYPLDIILTSDWTNEASNF